MDQELAAVLPEVAMRAVDAEELRELRASQIKSHAALEADHHALGDEIDDRTGTDGPRDEGDDAHEYGRACCKRPEPGGISPGDFGQRGADQQ